jgi:energy-coupling factor transporter ATP-binding protein EcfA2
MTERVSIETAGKLSAAFYRQLRIHGEPDRALVEATAGLADRPDILIPALYSRLGSRPLFDDAAARPLTASEIDFGLTRLEALLQTRAPVLLQPDETGEEHSLGFPAAAANLRATAPESLDSVASDVRDRWNASLAEVSSICMEAIDMSFAPLASGKEPPPYDSRTPFRGLSPFLFEDRNFFFGRDHWITELRQRLAANPFLAVLGPSGSGKSSLVFAGLIPTLITEDANLAWASFRPGESPIVALDAVLAKLPENAGLLVADQFEEIFTQTRDENVRKAFFDRLLAETTKRSVVLTMRADFWGDCAEHPKLREAMQANQQLIPPMSAEELRNATEEQTSKVGFRFEAGLAATIIDEIRDEPGAMPLLQHALLELWNRRHGRWLKLSEYRALGGVRKAISATAEAVFQRLDPGDQERVRDIFLRLTRLDADGAGQSSARNTRRRVPLALLVPEGEDPAVTRELVADLANARLVVVTEEPHQP